MLLIAAAINEEDVEWSTHFFYLIQAEKATFNLTVSGKRILTMHSVHILFQLNRAR